MAQLPILAQTEQVFMTFLQNAIDSGSLGTALYGLIEQSKRSVFPAVNVVASTADEINNALQTANWRVSLQIQVEEKGATTPNDSLLAGTIFEFINYDGVEVDLTNISPRLFVYEVIPRKPTNSIQGDYRVQEMSYDVICRLT